MGRSSVAGRCTTRSSRVRYRTRNSRRRASCRSCCSSQRGFRSSHVRSRAGSNHGRYRRRARSSRHIRYRSNHTSVRSSRRTCRNHTTVHNNRRRNWECRTAWAPGDRNSSRTFCRRICGRRCNKRRNHTTARKGNRKLARSSNSLHNRSRLHSRNRCRSSDLARSRRNNSDSRSRTYRHHRS
jgi:hypothetical protein